MMRRLLLALLFCQFWSSAGFTQGFGFSPPPGIAAQDEGTPIAGRTLTINCTGAGVSCTGAPLTTINVTGGGGGGNYAEVSLTISDAVAGLIYTTTVTGQAWVGASSQIICAPFADGSGSTPLQLTFAAGQTVIVSNRVAGTGFDVTVFNPHGATGTFKFHCTGA